MIIGVAKETIDQEFRIALTPAGARELKEAGHRILVERGAGLGSGFSDADFRKAGATLANRRRLFSRAQMILKVKEPTRAEASLLGPEQILFAFLHLAANRQLTEELIERRVTAIAYETVESVDGARPLLSPMSEVAGRMAVLIGAYLLQKGEGGSGILISGIAGVESGRVVILGSGVVGKNAARIALGLGGRVIVLSDRPSQLAALDDLYLGRVMTVAARSEAVEKWIEHADLAIGAVSVSGERTPMLVSRRTVGRMRPRSVIVDVSIDQGGCFETSRRTTHSDPTFIAEGVLHYCVPNIPGVVPRTSTIALTQATLPYVKKIAAHGLSRAVEQDETLARGVNLRDGKIVYPALARAFSGVRSD